MAAYDAHTIFRKKPMKLPDQEHKELSRKNSEFLQRFRGFVEASIAHYRTRHTTQVLTRWLENIYSQSVSSTDPLVSLDELGITPDEIAYLVNIKVGDGWMPARLASKRHQSRYPGVIEPVEDEPLTFTWYQDGKKLTASGEDITDLAKDLAKLGYRGPNITVYDNDGPMGFAGVKPDGRYCWQTY